MAFAPSSPVSLPPSLRGEGRARECQRLLTLGEKASAWGGGGVRGAEGRAPERGESGVLLEALGDGLRALVSDVVVAEAAREGRDRECQRLLTVKASTFRR